MKRHDYLCIDSSDSRLPFPFPYNKIMVFPLKTDIHRSLAIVNLKPYIQILICCKRPEQNCFNSPNFMSQIKSFVLIKFYFTWHPNRVRVDSTQGPALRKYIFMRSSCLLGHNFNENCIDAIIRPGKMMTILTRRLLTGSSKKLTSNLLFFFHRW